MKSRHPDKCGCPYCVEELKDKCIEPAFCKPCGVELVECGTCRKQYSRKLGVCPSCGAKRK